MFDVRNAVTEIQAAFASPDYPLAFLDTFDQMECLGHHNGIETFLVQKKSDDSLHVAKCYDRAVYANLPEGNALPSLSHPGLPEFGEVYANDAMICVVRAYVEGVSLAEYVKKESLTREQVVEIGVKLCGVLQYLHEQPQPIIHRDIKPQNVILRTDGTPVLIDFDIARVYKGNAEFDTYFFGTQGYAPPEQYGFTETDARADIYSLGVLLRYLMTGNVRPNGNVTFYKPLQKIIDKCTAFAPKDRYGDMRAVQRALLAANPKAQFWRGCLLAVSAAVVAIAIAFAIWRIYDAVTFDPFSDGHIPAVATDDARTADAVAYLREKYGTHLFDDTDRYATFGLLRQALTEAFGKEERYVYTMSEIDPPMESDACFFPWGIGDEQYVDRNYMAYVAVKTFWPQKVADWSSLTEDTGEYPGISVALAWCDKTGILTGVNRPQDITVGQAAIAFANADRVFCALQGE